MAEVISLGVSPNLLAMAPEIVYCPLRYTLPAITIPMRGKAMTQLAMLQAAAMPEVKACWAAPTVAGVPMNSDIITTPATAAGRARAATMNWSVVLLRSQMLKPVVITI